MNLLQLKVFDAVVRSGTIDPPRGTDVPYEEL